MPATLPIQAPERPDRRHNKRGQVSLDGAREDLGRLGCLMSGRSKQGRSKYNARSADLSVPLPRDLEEYDGDHVDISEDVVYAGEAGAYEMQVVVRSVRSQQNGQLVDFAACLQARLRDVDEGWADVERVDCAHGYVHVDRFDADGTPTKDATIVPAECKTDLDLAIVWATGYIWDLQSRMTGRAE
jgi:hypothetical protein